MRNFRIDTGENVNATDAVAAKNCNAIVFVNIGDEIAYVNNRPVPVYASGMQEYPSITYCGLEGEIMLGQFQIKFAGGGTNPNLLVIRKYYN